MGCSLVQTYLQEADELIADIEQSALALDAEENSETVNRLFRAFHTIKGSGAMCGFSQLAEFTHHVETLLDAVRQGKVPVSQELGDLVLAAVDQIKLLLAAESGGEPVAAEAIRKLIERIEELSEAQGSLANAPAGAPRRDPRGIGGKAKGQEQIWRIRFHPNPGLLACGGNPVLLFQDLRELGECEIEGHAEDVPALDELQPDLCFLWWDITLRSADSENDIRDVFLFVDDGNNLEIEMAPSASVQEMEAGAAAGARVDPSGTTSGAARLISARDQARKALTKESTVRVPAGRLDRLVNLVGELVMNQSRLTQVASQLGVAELANPVQEIERLVAELREDVLEIRMLPIGTLFGRFRRLVHDLGAELGKEAELITEGADTELDKSILDQLGEPLVHLLRNSMDHGIESPAQRAALGKPPRGTIRLKADHAGSDVVIRIEDDGRGIDLAAVRAKAIERQLMARDAVLGEKDLLNLILLPGFSTAERVSSVSGRGVGMDVVKRQIDALRGTLAISTQVNHGCQVFITLPLTLAIIEGLLVQVDADHFIVPMAAVTENGTP